MPEEVDNWDLDNRTCGTGLGRYMIIEYLGPWGSLSLREHATHPKRQLHGQRSGV